MKEKLAVCPTQTNDSDHNVKDIILSKTILCNLKCFWKVNNISANYCI